MRQDEAALLAAAFVDDQFLLEIDLRPEEFSDQDGAGLFQAMQALATEGMRVDPLSLQNRLGKEWVPVVARVAAMSSSPRNAHHYANSIAKAARGRRLKRVLGEVGESLSQDGDPDELTSRVFAELAEHSGGHWEWDMSRLMSVCIEEINDAVEQRQSGGQVGVPFGLSKLDQKFGGLIGGRLYVLGGRPKMGKTSAALHTIMSAARNGYTVGFASTEMAAPECGKRFLACVAGIEAYKIVSGDLTQREQQQLVAASNRLRELPIRILDRAGVRPSEIRRQSMAWQKRYGLDLLAVDYLQRLRSDDAGERRDLVVGEMCRAHKNLARDLNIPVLLLAQLSRDLERREDKRPLMSDFRDSGEVEQEADWIGFIYRDCVYNEAAQKTDAEIIVRGNRHGPSGFVKVHFDEKLQRWMDLDVADYREVA